MTMMSTVENYIRNIENCPISGYDEIRMVLIRHLRWILHMMDINANKQPYLDLNELGQSADIANVGIYHDPEQNFKWLNEATMIYNQWENLISCIFTLIKSTNEVPPADYRQ